MVFTLLFGAAAALIALLLFNSGMLANAKTRLQNAADAGAYSAGLLQARDHNFSAYTNRSMVANQVAVAQLVSLKSYLEDAAWTHRRMSEFLLNFEASTFPSSKPLWDYGKNVPIENVNSVYAQIAPIAVQGLDRLIRAHETAQHAHHGATLIDIALVADEVVKRNDPNAKMTTGAFTVARTAVQVNNWGDSTKRHQANGTSPEANRFADVVVSNQSTDVFTRKRYSGFLPTGPVPAWASTIKWCRLLPNHVSSTTVFSFTHKGGTLLSADKKRWLALDATTGYGAWSCTVWYPCWTGICYTSINGPHIDGNFGLGGSAGGLAGRNGGYGTMTGYTGNPSDTRRYGNALLPVPPMLHGTYRYASQGPGNTLDANGGLQDYYRDMDRPATSRPANQSPELNGGAHPVAIEVERTGDTVRTSSKILEDNWDLWMVDGMKGNTMRATSAAHAYFYRPRNEPVSSFTRSGWRRSDNRTEIANQFNPYWQSRLVDRSIADRAASWAAQ